MERCGMILPVDTQTNTNNIIKIISYSGTNVITADKTVFSEYEFCRHTFKLLSKTESEDTRIPYINLLELLDAAVAVDKKNKFNRILRFKFDSNDKPVVFAKQIIKDVFPLPNKNIAYMGDVGYYNITDKIFKSNVTSELYASVACDHLNNIAVNSGVVFDRMFEFSCGRLFVNLNLLNSSMEGRKFFGIFAENHKDITAFHKIKLKSINIKREYHDNSVIKNDTYSNDFIKYHTKTAQALYGKDILSVLINPTYFCENIINELDCIQKSFDCSRFPGMKQNDILYLSIFDVFRLFSDPEFSLNVTSYISDVRKVYNANKHRNIICFKSDGSLYCIP